MKAAVEDVDVFNGPHARMRVLLDRMNVRLANTDFRDRNSVATLLFELQYIFSEFKQHEEIEDMYIVGELRTRMVRGHDDDDGDDDDNDAGEEDGAPGEAATAASGRRRTLPPPPPPPITLEKDLHSDDRLRAVIHVISNVQDVTGRATCNRVVRLRQGQRLCKVLDEFTVDFVPHMVEEEQVFQPLLLLHFTALELIRLRDKVIQLHTSNVRASTSAVSGPLSTLAWWGRGLPGPAQLQLQAQQQQRQPEPPPAPPAAAAGGATARASSTTIDSLPCELVLHILRLMDDVPSLMRAARVCRYWHALAFDGSLWRSLYLRRWFLGQWGFSAPATYGDHSDQSDEEEDEEEEDGNGRASGTAAAVDSELLGQKESLRDYDDGDDDNDVASPHKQRGARALWHRGEMSVRRTASEEKQFLDAVCRHLLPKVGRHAHVLSLHGSTSLTNDLLRRILYLCPNISHLSIAYTTVSTFGLDSRLHRRLTRLSASACANISDVAVQKLALCLRPAGTAGAALGRFSLAGGTPTTTRSTECLSQPAPLLPSSPLGRTASSPEHGDSSSAYGGGGSGRDLRACTRSPRLWYLDLSGCHMLTDSGIEHLIGVGPHTDMIHLDLSGLHRITGETVKRFVAMCPVLHPERFYYCERIPHGEDQVMKTAEMCRGICHKGIACCRLAC